MYKNNFYYNNYIQYIYISKFVLNNWNLLFKIHFIQYKTDINKTTLVNLFWIFFVLFNQLPKFIMYTTQKIEKISHGCLIITKTCPDLYFNFKKILNYLLISSSINVIRLEKKNKNIINNIIFKNNNYFSELTKLPTIITDPYDLMLKVKFNSNFISIVEKIQALRMLQIPLVLGWNTKISLNKLVIYKKRKVNHIK